MGVLNWLTGGVSKVIDSAGDAVNKNYKTMRGDKAEVEAAIHDEQMAVLAEHAAEFVSRPTRSRLDAVIDFINRLPRPLITFAVLWMMVWPYFSPSSYIDYISSIQLMPDELWTLFLAVISLYFGGRIISSDIHKPKLSTEQKKQALEVIKEREQAIIEARTPLIVEVAPTRKPPQPVAFPTPEPTLPPSKLPDLPPDTATSVAVEIMIENLIHREGGWVNLEADRGGPTNFGVTLATLADWRNAPTTADDVKALKRTEAADIYRANYFLLPGIDTLPVGLQAHVFDCAVNSGPRTAVRLLQRSLNSMGERLAVDGVIGDATRDACRKYDAGKINDALALIRIRFYNDICAADPTQKVFLAGWERRARSFSTGPGIAA